MFPRRRWLAAALPLALLACSTFSESTPQAPSDDASTGPDAGAEAAVVEGGFEAGTDAPAAGSGVLPEGLRVGLIARWRFEDGPGTTAANEVVGSPPGTITGGTFVPGKVGQGLDLDGVSGRVTVPPALSLAVTTSFTLALWVNLAAGDGQRFISRPPIDFKLNGARPQLSVMSDVATSSTTLKANEWHHVTAVYENRRSRIFVDGIQTALDRDDEQPVTVPPQTDPLYIGAFEAGSGFADGLLDEVCIWKRALTPSEIDVLAKSR